MKTLWTDISIASVSLIAGVLLGLYLADYGSRRLDPASGPEISRVTVTPKAPVLALNKPELRAKKLIPAKVAEDDTKAVLAQDSHQDLSGTTEIGAVMDLNTGQTSIVKDRPFAEWMKGNELGAGASIGSLGLGYQIEYERTFARIGKFYPTFRGDLWMWQSGPRLDAGHRYDGQVSVFATLRW